YLTYFKDNHFHVYDTRSGTHKNVTELIPHPVWNLRDDRPGIKGPFGFGGWLKGDAAFLVYDEYDVWRVSPDGGMPRKLTSGRDGQSIYRMRRVDFEDPFLGPAKPIMLTITNDYDRQTGYAQLDLRGKVTTLVFEPMSIGRLSKAKNPDM